MSEKKEKKLKTFQNGRQYRRHNGKKRWKIDLWTHLYIHVQIQICRIQQIERMWIEFNQIDVKRLWPFFLNNFDEVVYYWNDEHYVVGVLNINIINRRTRGIW